LAKWPPKAGTKEQPGDPQPRQDDACSAQSEGVAGDKRRLASQLRDAVTDSYARQASKRSRYRPPNPDKKPLGDPKLRSVTKREKKILERAEARKSE
jgi:hypothetical protein